MKILVIGSGGREHALCWALRRSPSCSALYCAPGNAGIAEVAACLDIAATDQAAITAFCRAESIGLVVIGPEDPLVQGLADTLTAEGFAVFGPSASAARLEGSKAFTKELCRKYNIPTAAYGTFDDAEAAKAFVREHGAPIVVKADGLAAGKGVVIAQTVAEAEAAIGDMLDGRFGAAGATVVIEEFLEGEELSLFALCDGETALLLGSAQDHKRAFDGDRGPNTGGMGTYSPAPVGTPELHAEAMRTIIAPTLDGLKAEGIRYRGVLFAGLMLTARGPMLLEYNCRFGDPETQVLMRRLMSDPVTLLHACATGTLAGQTVALRDAAAVCVVMASNGYPGEYEKGTEIKGLEEAPAAPEVTIFHAGTARRDGRLLATGGRVLNVTATGNTVEEARTRCYDTLARIHWPEGFFRTDIAWRALKKAA